MSVQGSDKKKAIELYERAAAVFRISRFPSVDGDETGFKRGIFNEQVQVYLRGASLWDAPLKQVVIPHTAAAGEDGKEIPLFVRIPSGASESKKCPVVLLLTGLDGHRPDNTGVSPPIKLHPPPLTHHPSAPTNSSPAAGQASSPKSPEQPTAPQTAATQHPPTASGPPSSTGSRANPNSTAPRS